MTQSFSLRILMAFAVVSLLIPQFVRASLSDDPASQPASTTISTEADPNSPGASTTPIKFCNCFTTGGATVGQSNRLEEPNGGKTPNGTTPPATR